MCFLSCPDRDLGLDFDSVDFQTYIANYSDFTCVKSNFQSELETTEKISIQFVPFGYRKRIPKD
jgi:hypothetical protein